MVYHHFTTLNLLKIYTELDSVNFWYDKFEKLYLNKSFNDFLTNQDNFLINERYKNNFSLAFKEDNNGQIVLYKNILYEDDGSLKDKFNLYNNVEDFVFVNIKVNKQYVLISGRYENLTVLEQFDTYSEAEDYIENDITDNNIVLPIYRIYFIVNMDHIVLCFDRIELERTPNKNECYYGCTSYNFKRMTS